MIKQPNMKLIGLFVSIGLISMFLMFAYFLKSKFSDDESTVVMYFDESVKGLDVGAPVLFKGVKIGEVSEVRLQANLHTLQFLIPVYAKIYNGRSLITDTHDEKERLDKFIRDGLRAHLGDFERRCGRGELYGTFQASADFEPRGERARKAVSRAHGVHGDEGRALLLKGVHVDGHGHQQLEPMQPVRLAGADHAADHFCQLHASASFALS